MSFRKEHEQGPTEDAGEPESSPEEPDAPRGIRCPRCAYRPSRQDRWQCSCFHRWNTFDTAGRCPACGLQWRETACPACSQWSLHLDWYE